MTSHPTSQTIATHMLPNISGSENNQTMKFGQLLEYNMRNIFLEKSYTKYNGETIPRTLLVYNLGVIEHLASWDIFRLRSITRFWLRKFRENKLSKFIKIFNYNKSLCIIFCVKMS